MGDKMKIFNVLDVREREGKPPAYAEIGTIFLNEETGKQSLYLPITGRFYPIKEQTQRQGGTSYPQAASAPAPSLPGGGPGAFPGEAQPDSMPPIDDTPW
jgi:hypothetical protein